MVTPPGGENRIQLFPLDSPATIIFNQFDGHKSLGETAHALVDHIDWELPQSFAYARGVFLAMVLVRICQPMNFLDDES